MTRLTHISAVRFSAAAGHDLASGLLGWASFTICGLLRVDGVTVRRTRAGRIALSWPERRDRAGIGHSIVRPINDGARRILEAQVLDALGISTEEPSAGR